MAKGPGTVLPLPDVIARWELGPLPEPVPLTGGYHNDVFRLGDAVARVERREPASVAWEHELLAWLAAEVPEVIAPLAAPDGSTLAVVDDRVISLFPFVDGAPATGLAAAPVYARIHARGASWEREA